MATKMLLFLWIIICFYSAQAVGLLDNGIFLFKADLSKQHDVHHPFNCSQFDA